MKNLFLFLLTFSVMSAQAQVIDLAISDNADAHNLTNKNGLPILPEKGDIAIGIEASPLFDFVGNLLKINSGGTFNDPSSFNFADGTNITLKYFTGHSTAIRTGFNIAWNSDVTKWDVADAGDPNAFTNKMKESYWGINVNLGIEKHRGKTRLQGIYGLEGNIVLNRGTMSEAPNVKYDYESPLIGGTRTLEIKQALVYGIGANAFVGVEYFIMPKISMGGEFLLGFLLQDQGNSKTETETLNGNTIETNETEQSNGGTYSIFTSSTGGSIYLLFHF